MKGHRQLILLAVALAALAGASVAKADDAVTLRLNWLIYGFHSPFYLGLERGYYKEEGIDLTINEGQGSGKAVQIVAAGADTFGVSDSGSVIAGVSKGAPIKSVFAMSNASPYAVGFRADLGITSAKDMEGKTIAATAGEAGIQLFPAIIAANKLDKDKVKFLMVDGPGKMVSVLEKRTEGLLAGLDNQCLILPARGADVTCLSYASLGVNTVGLTVHTRTELLEDNPDLVRRFVKATVRAFEAAVADPVASVEAGMKHKAGVDKELWLEQIKVGFSLLKTPHTEKLPLGHFSEADWADTLRLMKEYRGLKSDKPVTAFFTNEYLPN